MKLIEHTYGLFPYYDFAFPEGEYSITFSNKEYKITCKQVVQLAVEHFSAIEELNIFFQSIQKRQKEFINSIPYVEERGVIVYGNFFDKQLKKTYEEKSNIKEVIEKLSSRFYYFAITEDHEFDENQINLMDFINKIRDKDGKDKAKDLFFAISKEFHEYVLILRTPYVNLLDINYIYMKGMYSFFTRDDGSRCTNVVPFRFDYFFPKPNNIKLKVQNFFDKKLDIPLDDLFIAKAKAYMRLENYAMAIIHAVVALEIIVPKYINGYLKLNDINKKVVEDFNNKFGLSVRVKALLKLMIPSKHHHLITNVGIIINYRNKIMHEGKTNNYFKNINNINELISDCESLINILKKIGTMKKIFE